ncbi:MAG TPA: lipopolysaccharide assembly protein LapB [Gammaproteobacteria bacterium]
MDWSLLFLLLPVAAFSGWLIGRNKSDRREQHACDGLNAGYLKGLNYLLNEQSDKALEVFIQMLEVDSETIETHFALGNLFLRRGEVDRAIRIHQNLIARPTLTRLQRQQALFELGKDYLRAGLLDRAESLFIQVSDNVELAPLALTHLLEVYQLEKEWRKAIEAARGLKKNPEHESLQARIAHFLCEEAEEALRNKRDKEATRLVKEALEEDSNCVRATLLQARMEMAVQDFEKAINTLMRVEKQDAEFIPEICPLLRECHQHMGNTDELISFLGRLINDQKGGEGAVLLHAELVENKQGRAMAMAFLMDYLKEHPSLRVMKKLVEFKLSGQPQDDNADLVLVDNLIATRLAGRHLYQCRNCGFSARTLHWQCPTCKSWNSVKPMQGVDGE